MLLVARLCQVLKLLVERYIVVCVGFFFKSVKNRNLIKH